MLFLDLDRFKSVNDLHGHECDDALLAAVARAPCAAVRESDSVGRLSGDEFLIVGEGIRSEDAVVQLARRIPRAVATPLDLGDREVSVGASIRIAM